jgi:hypothetical protein
MGIKLGQNKKVSIGPKDDPVRSKHVALTILSLLIKYTVCDEISTSYTLVKLGLSREGKNTDWGYLRTGCLEEYLDIRGMKGQEARETCIMRSFMICTLHQI